LQSDQPHTAAGIPKKSFKPMTSITCLVATVLALLTIPVMVLLWLTESKQQRAQRLRKSGHTFKAIAAIIGVKSPTTARKYAMA